MILSVDLYNDGNTHPGGISSRKCSRLLELFTTARPTSEFAYSIRICSFILLVEICCLCFCPTRYMGVHSADVGGGGGLNSLPPAPWAWYFVRRLLSVLGGLHSWNNFMRLIWTWQLLLITGCGSKGMVPKRTW